MALNTSDFQTVFDDNFAKDTSLNTSLWGNSWGYSSQYVFGGGALTITSLQSQYFYPVGFMQATPGKSAGEGYGLYQFSGYANAGQGQGISFIMWRADNQWLDPAHPGTITEIDVLESWDGTLAGESTLHWYAANAKYNDGYTSKQFNIDLTRPHTYAVDWEHGSLTFYIDGQELYRVTSNVPLDAAEGGSNEVMGAQIINGSATAASNAVSLHITDMSYSAPLGTVAPPPPPPPANPNPVTLGGGAQSYVAPVGATVQAGSGGDTITAAGGLVQVTGGTGSLDFIGGAAPSTVLAGAGSATLFGGAGGGVYSGGAAGHNLLVSQGASGANTTLTGGGAGDQIFGSATGHDVLVAGPGRASILGGGGTTSITGGSAAASVIFTGSGATTVAGGAAGGDTIVGGAGSLSVNANRGDAIFGNAGTLAVTGSGSGSGADSIVGGAGGLSVAGRGANMLVVAGSGPSSIDTGNGASLIFTGAGNSSVTGGNGSMQVVLGSGGATITEGSGGAVFDVVKGNAGGNFVLNGFRPGTDRIELYGYQQADLRTTSVGGSTMLNLADGTRIQLVGVGNPGHSIIG